MSMSTRSLSPSHKHTHARTHTLTHWPSFCVQACTHYLVPSAHEDNNTHWVTTWIRISINSPFRLPEMWKYMSSAHAELLICFSARKMVVGDADPCFPQLTCTGCSAAPVKLSLKWRELIMGAAPAVLYQQQPAFLQSSPAMAPSGRCHLSWQSTKPCGRRRF